MSSISCVRAGVCTAVGSYDEDISIRTRVFVVNEKDGVWGTAIVIPTRGHTYLNSISCATARSCAAGGSYTDRHGHSQAFLVTEQSGVWGKPIKVPGTTSLNHGDAYLYTISCPKPRFCAAGGTYDDSSRRSQAFVVNEENGVWRKAIEVPGLTALDRRGFGFTEVGSISCAAARSCAAGGEYFDAYGLKAFVVDEKNGVWGRAIRVPGLAALSRGSLALGEVNSISCAAAGFCAAGGFYSDGTGRNQAFVVNERKGVWRKAIEVPGTEALNIGDVSNGVGGVSEVSCSTARSCAAIGAYNDGDNDIQAFVVSETNGIWRQAIEVPGLAALNAGGDAAATSISCAKAGSCAAGGSYNDGSGAHVFQAFVVTETDGVWSNAVEVPGSADLNLGGNAMVDGISCATASSCVAGGSYTDGSGQSQAFVTEP